MTMRPCTPKPIARALCAAVFALSFLPAQAAWVDHTFTVHFGDLGPLAGRTGQITVTLDAVATPRDPGMTLLQVLGYASTDLAYRSDLGLEDAFARLLGRDGEGEPTGIVVGQCEPSLECRLDVPTDEPVSVPFYLRLFDNVNEFVYLTGDANAGYTRQDGRIIDWQRDVRAMPAPGAAATLLAAVMGWAGAAAASDRRRRHARTAPRD
ncbi:hypothetical protein MOJ79_10075 [Calidifontimicrobium sp. SYSU G02091]|uniref:hypothetical protein n=1 Tax=Calidifontimicrobium sp. SYSU G02091 TaxID=2926421 RepID=UPI001F53BD30|nr:hypothetical protein [Calidifontimicrobium sp. SYSU G02091]MCI1192189.1 hypothetical protein [Calidifontimicrobium sp. SYSU G02091]